ncbi:hypothetical protein QAD02_020621 [Eretmocerus hayati]|uniref:Uncharacterized protein n=1 Tax=Eretmocerus hayati TaxID=131215 RepID=A0ACC2PNY1_9HYME|nr:hypothetical protein QAD02_020621 [Eretmocerus hayati]
MHLTKKFISVTASVLFTPQEMITSALDPTQVRNLVPGQPRPQKINRSEPLLLLSLYHDFVSGEGAMSSLEEEEKLLLKDCAYLSRFLYDERDAEIKKLRLQAQGENIDRA